MWSSNIGWNADSQIGVVSCRQLLKPSYLAAQHHLWAMQRSSDNVTFAASVERLATCAIAVAANALRDDIPRDPLGLAAWAEPVCPDASRPCVSAALLAAVAASGP